MGQNKKNQIKLPSNHSLSHERGSEQRNRASERSGGRERSKRTSERCKQTSERTTGWPSTFVWILHYSGPQCSVCLVICVVNQSVGHTFFVRELIVMFCLCFCKTSQMNLCEIFFNALLSNVSTHMLRKQTYAQVHAREHALART